MTVEILFAVMRARGWEIIVEDDWDIEPTLVAIGNRYGKSVSVNGSKDPVLQAIAVTAIVRLHTGSFCDNNFFPTFREGSENHFYKCEWNLIKDYWDEIKTVLDAVSAQQKVR